MKKIAPSLAVLMAALVLVSYARPVQAAGNFRTWISAAGDNANGGTGCQPSAPCLTFGEALSQTSPGGEVNCLGQTGEGAAGYGETALNIDQAVTIDCHGAFGGKLAINGINAIVINAAGAVVTLRGLSLQGFSDNNGSGATAGLNGVVIQAAAVVNIEDSVIENFLQSGVSVTTAANTIVNIKNTTIRNAANGISFAPAGGVLNGSIDHSTIVKMSGDGIIASGAAYFTVTNSLIVNAAGVGVSSVGGAVLEVDSSSVSNNRTAFATSGGIIRISHNLIYDNTANFSIAGGTIATSGDNKVAVNGSTVPNGTITQQ